MRADNSVCFLGALVLTGTLHAAEPLPPDGPMGSQTLPSSWNPHWIWVNDFVFPHMTDGMAYLIDGDKGTYLGTLSTGMGFNRVLVPASGDIMYSPETYFSRGTRGTRTDVVTLYNRKTLSPAGEIIIPPKRASNLPMMADVALTDDDRFLLIYNFNPAQSVTVVDTQKKSFVGEIETAGCALVYPTGPRTFFSICADGGTLSVELNDTGAEARRARSEPLFDVAKDPVSEKGVRDGSRWLFASFDGEIYPVEVNGITLTRGTRWSLVSDVERKAKWRPGGLQHLAVQAKRHELYSVMHQGELSSHKDPGKSVWVYDLATHKKVRSIALREYASAINLSTDDKPLLFSVFVEGSTLDVYDPVTTKHLRSVEHVGTTPTLLVNAP